MAHKLINNHNITLILYVMRKQHEQDGLKKIYLYRVSHCA